VLVGGYFFDVVRDTDKFAACDFETVVFQIFLNGGVLRKFAAMVISLPNFVNTRDMLPQRFIFLALRYSNALPHIFKFKV